MKEVIIYTDGACSGNPGEGGYCAILFYGENRKTVSGYESKTTNNRMELMAVIKGLECLKEECKVVVYSDSAYTIGAFEQGWIYSWLKSGWRKADRSEVKNVDLWQKLLDLSKKHKISFVKVKGHSDNEYNNLCDKIAREEISRNGKKEITNQ